MAGAPSQLDLFDYKPLIENHFGEDLRSMSSIQMGQRLTTMTSGQSTLPLAPSKYRFQQYGQSGAWVSELLPVSQPDGGRPGDSENRMDRGDQSRSGDHLHLHRTPVARVAPVWERG